MIEIQLGGKRGGVAIVDDSLTEALKYSWRQNSRGYVVTNLPRNGAKTQVQLLLHHLAIRKPSKGLVTDHINHDRLDNRSENLRHCTVAENQHNQDIGRSNTSGYKGVSFDAWARKYRAYIWLNKKSVKLGTFKTAEEAHEAYKQAAVKNFGEYAYA